MSSPGLRDLGNTTAYLFKRPSGRECWLHHHYQVGIYKGMSYPRMSVVPTVLRIGPYRFFFYANENGEPAHIHVQRDKALAKFWLEPARYASSTGFPAHESKLLELVELHQRAFEEAWDEFYGD